jgi:hypothetical protein
MSVNLTNFIPSDHKKIGTFGKVVGKSVIFPFLKIVVTAMHPG